MQQRLSRLFLGIAAVAAVSLAGIQTGHANKSACINPGNANPTPFLDSNEGTKRINWNLWRNWFGLGVLEITSTTGGVGNWTFNTTLFVQSTQGIVDSKAGSGTRFNGPAGNLFSAAPPPAPDYWFFSCGTTDPI